MECWLPRTQIVDPTGCGIPARAVADSNTLSQFDNRTHVVKDRTHYDPRGPMDGSRVHYCHSALTNDERAPCGSCSFTGKGLAHLCSRSPPDDCQIHDSNKDGALCERRGGREAVYLAHNQHQAFIPHSSLPGNDQQWQNYTMPSSTTMQKCTLNPETRPSNEMEKALRGPETSNEASALPSTPSAKVSWMGPAGQRRSRRRYQLWRESRRFLDTCYYGSRDLGTKLPYDLQGTRPQAASQPPPLLPLSDLPDGSSSGSVIKPPPPLMPLNDAASTSQPTRSYLYPPEVGLPVPSTQPLSMVETAASGQPQTGINIQVPRFMYPLPEVAPSGLPGHQQLYQPHFHNLPDYTTYLHQLHHSPHLNIGGDAFRRIRHQLHPFPHLPRVAEVNQADVNLPSLTSAEALRTHHVNASYLRSLRSILREHLQ